MLAYAAMLFAAVFAYIFLLSPTAHAEDLTWNGSAITYQNNNYVGPSNPPQGMNGLPGDAKVYTWTEDKPDGSQLLHIIYFTGGGDPSQAASASYAEYTYKPPNTYDGPSNQKTGLSVDKESYGKQGTQCAIQGIGWLVCPISNFLASGMDWIFDTLRGFVEVKPLGLSHEGSLYAAWDVMRGFANVMFIIGFIIVIYSQLTSMGLSNYGVKTMLPRLIIAAILVNISYYICAIAIDLSNIIGMSLQDLLVNLREQVLQHANASDAAIGWKDIVAFILSGGTAAVIGANLAIAATGGTIAGAIYAMVPMLIGLFLIILMVLIILAARQAIIIMLVIIAPLAFVAYLLPGTEKWFNKWRETFTTMLVFFPAFSLVFGGSQFAGQIIIQNAQSIIMLLFGMAVQIAPLAIVPLILRLSSGVLGRIAGMVNNQQKGFADRTKGWAKERQELHKAKGIGDPNLSGRNFLRRRARTMEAKKRDLQRDTERYKQGFDEHMAKRSATNPVRQKVEMELELSKLRTDDWQNQTKKAVAGLRAGNYETLKALRQEDDSQGFVSRQLTNRGDYLRNKVGLATRYDDVALGALSKQALETEHRSRATSQAIQMAEHEQQSSYAQALLKNEDLRKRAGGISPKAADSVLAGAVAKERSDYIERVKEKAQLIKHFNPGGEKLQDLALGTTISVEKDGITYKFQGDDHHAREAAIEEKLKTGSFSDIQKIIMESGSWGTFKDTDPVTGQVKLVSRKGRTNDYATSIADAIADFKLQNKAAFFGGVTIDDVKLGKISGEAGLNDAAMRSLMTGKISAQALAGMNAKAIERLFDVTASPATVQYYQSELTANPKAADTFAESLRQLYINANEVLDNRNLKSIPDDAAMKILSDKLGRPTPPPTTPPPPSES